VVAAKLSPGLYLSWLSRSTAAAASNLTIVLVFHRLQDHTQERGIVSWRWHRQPPRQRTLFVGTLWSALSTFGSLSAISSFAAATLTGVTSSLRPRAGAALTLGSGSASACSTMSSAPGCEPGFECVNSVRSTLCGTFAGGLPEEQPCGSAGPRRRRSRTNRNAAATAAPAPRENA
jgi:hypothetical protein